MSSNQLTLLSSFATDRIFDEKNNLIREQEGGPALFIANALKQSKLSFVTFPTPKMHVDVVIKEGKEFGKIGACLTLEVDCAKINTPYLLISPILNEFNLKHLGRYQGKAFLDAQGFTRIPDKLGIKKNWVTTREIENSIFCLKVADYELQYLDGDFIKKQKKKIFIVTEGEKGVLLYAFGKSYFVKSRRIIKTLETLGAGDTFFANFALKYIETQDPLIAATFASDKTIKFLLSKE